MADNCWVVPAYIIELVGKKIRMPLSFRDPAHVVRDTAMHPRTNIAQTNRIFFMRPPCPFPIKIYTLWRNESIVASRMLLRSGAALLLCDRTRRFEPAWVIALFFHPSFQWSGHAFLPCDVLPLTPQVSVSYLGLKEKAPDTRPESTPGPKEFPVSGLSRGEENPS